MRADITAESLHRRQADCLPGRFGLVVTRIAEGRLDHVIDLAGRDELTALGQSMHAMQGELQKFVDAEGEIARQHDAGEDDRSGSRDEASPSAEARNLEIRDVRRFGVIRRGCIDSRRRRTRRNNRGP